LVEAFRKRMVAFRSIPRDPITSQTEAEAEQIIDSLAGPYQEIGGKVTKARSYGRRLNAAAIAALIGLGYLVLFSSSVYKSPVFFAVVAWVAVSLLFALRYQRKYEKISLSPDEKVFIDVYELASELRRYPLPIDMTGPASDLDYIIGDLEMNWTLGFRLAKEALSSVTEFIKNLRFKVLQAVVKGKTDDVKLSVWTLAKLCQVLIDEHPTVSQIEEINSKLSQLPKWEQVSKIKLHVKIRVWVANHSAVRSVGIACGSALVGVVIAALGNFLGYPSTGFAAGVGGAITLFVAFLVSPRVKKQ